jgi:hypothetical protein
MEADGRLRSPTFPAVSSVGSLGAPQDLKSDRIVLVCEVVSKLMWNGAWLSTNC